MLCLFISLPRLRNHCPAIMFEEENTPTKKRGALSCSLTGNVDQSNSRPKDGCLGAMLCSKQ